VAKEITIPKPTATQQEALKKAIREATPSTSKGSVILPAGQKPQLVWSVKKNSWQITTADKKDIIDVTYTEWQSGKKKVKKEEEQESISIAPLGGTVPYESRPFAETNPLLKVIEENNLQIVTDPENRGETYLAGKNRNKVYLYYGSAGVEVSDNYDKVKKVALDDLKSTGQLDAIFELLYKNKAISKETYNTKNTLTNDFNSAFVGLLSEYSKAAVAFNTTGVGQEPPNFLEYSLKLIGTGKGEGDRFAPTRSFQNIGEAELNAFIDQIYIETIGRKPNDEQRASKFKQLNKIIKKGILTTREKVGGEIQTRTTGGFDQQREGLELQEKLKTENPLEYERRQAFGFMDELQKVLGGGM
jgi:hypothetical protein